MCIYIYISGEIWNTVIISDFDNQIFIGVLFILPRRHGKIFNSIKYIGNMTNGYSIDLTFS